MPDVLSCQFAKKKIKKKNVKGTYYRVHMPDRTVPSRWFYIT